MKVFRLALLLSLLFAGAASQAQDSFRLRRPMEAPQLIRSAAAPMPEAPPQRVETSLANPGDFTGMVPAFPRAGAGSRSGDAGLRAFQSSAGRSMDSQTVVRVPVRTPPVDPMFGGSVTQVELQNLGKHDVVLIIDKSASMRETDCPGSGGGGFFGGMSRWDWCANQTLQLARQTSAVLPRGMTIVLFSTFTKVFTQVDMERVPQIFREYSPGGITREASAVRKVLEDYFHRRDAGGGVARPLVVAVITDGLPTSPEDLRDVIIDATRQMRRPDEVRLTFLQVGQDPQGQHFVQDLDRGLLRDSAKYDIVSAKTFPQLLRTGLTRALVDSISMTRRPF